jgi:hypothetical protein
MAGKHTGHHEATACNNEVAVRGSVFYAVHPKAIQQGPTRQASQLLSLVSCKSAAIQQGCEHGSRGISSVGSHYQAVTSEDIGDFMCATFTVICRVCRSHATVIVTYSYELEVFSKSNYQSEPSV